MRITFVDKHRKRERRFIELVDPISTASKLSMLNFYRHFIANRTTPQAIEAAAEHCKPYPHLADDLAAFKQALTENL